MFSRSMVRSVVFACFAFAAPLTAFADETPRESDGQHREAKAFPMEAAKFKVLVDARVAKVRERVVARMSKRDVPADKQKEILVRFDSGAVKVKDLATEVGKDGTVTKEEAKSVRALAKQLRKEARGKGQGRGKHADRRAE